MTTLPKKTADNAVATTLSLLEDLFGSYHPRNFSVRIWDGTTWGPEAGQPARFTLVLQHPGALRRMFLPPNELTLGEAYIYDDFDIEGEIEAVFPLADRFMGERWGKIEQARRFTNDVTYRIWRLYMAGSAYGFQMNRNTIYQTLLAKPERGDSGLPLTRADWYM